MTHTLDGLPGENKIQIITRKRMRKECDVCGEPAHYKHTFLYSGARTNPASSAFRRDDVSWCEDAALFACKEHNEEVRRTPPDGTAWCATYSANERFAHLFLYWTEMKSVEP